MNVSRWKHLSLGIVALGATLAFGACGVEGGDDIDGDRTTLAAGARDPGPGDLSVSLAAARTTVAKREAVLVDVTFTNLSRHAVRLLGWKAIAEDLEDDLFVVARPGGVAGYIGPHYKRPAPTDADFVVLPPGASVTRTVDMTAFYDFSSSDRYTIRYEAAVGSAKLASNDVTLWVEGRISAPVAEIGTLSYTACTAAQTSTVGQAVNAASTMANGADAYLAGTGSGTPRYTTWFGTYSSSNWNTAKSHFTSIKGAIDTKPLAFDCSCKKRYYAYVYPTQPYKIYLCSVFWKAPLTGTDSKGGTLIHEISHFNVVAGTDDYVYGQAGAKSLAASDPQKALFNADNHEYFAENTPYLQ